jgi:flagellar capping protein FliD
MESGTDRVAKSTFTFKVNGYIIPNTINKDLSTIRNKFYTTSQIVFDLEVIDAAGVVTNVDALKFANKPAAQNSAGSTSFIGGGINVTNNTLSGAAEADLTYLNTNKQLTADILTINTATFTGASLLEPSTDSTLPATSAINFTFYVNSVHITPSIITITSTTGGVTFTFDTASLGYTLDNATDTVIAIGKFQ